MGPSAPVIPADPVTSSLNLPEDRPEAAESDRLQLHFTEAAAAMMMMCVVGDEGGGGGCGQWAASNHKLVRGGVRGG